MANETTFRQLNSIDGRGWLTYFHKGKEGRFALPPFVGTHEECYQAIKEGGFVPAEGLDLALLMGGIYKSNWAMAGLKIANKHSPDAPRTIVRTPIRGLWIPPEKDLAGILLEKDLEGRGMSTEIQFPKDISKWTKGENGIYVSPDGNQTFIPEGSYKLGEHTPNSFARDGFATAVLTAEGAEICAKAAGHLYIKGYDVKNPYWHPTTIEPMEIT